MGWQVSLLRYPLGALLAVGALNAFAGGCYGLLGAEGVPVEWLEGSPFNDYFVPSLVLFMLVGGSFLFASIAVFEQFRVARASAFAAGTIVLVWIAIQVTIIGYVSWMQPATAFAGLLVVMLARRLPHSFARSSGTSKWLDRQ
jgi:hypothetical protein